MSRKELARALLRVQRSTEARSQLEIILAGGPDAEASWLLSRSYLQEGKLPEALAAFKAGSSFPEEYPTSHDPARLTGAKSCAPCHSEKYHYQQNSRHARTFHRIAELPDLELPKGSIADPADSKVIHEFQRVQDNIEQTTHVGGNLYQAVVDYAFGSGDRGKTMVGHDQEGHNFELRLSVYHEKTAQAKWDMTSGHALHPSSDQDFLGVPLTEDAVRRCFLCHVTSPRTFLEAGQYRVQIAQLAVKSAMVREAIIFLRLQPSFPIWPLLDPVWHLGRVLWRSAPSATVLEANRSSQTTRYRFASKERH